MRIRFGLEMCIKNQTFMVPCRDATILLVLQYFLLQYNTM